MISGVIPLEGGPCEFIGAEVYRQKGKARFFFADLAFGNGQRIEGAPTYVTFSEGEAEALEKAEQAGHIAAEAGKLDLYALIQHGALPYVSLFLRLMQEARDVLAQHLPADSIKHSIATHQSEKQTYLQAGFLHEGSYLQKAVSLELPVSHNMEAIRRMVQEQARQRWGEAAQATNLKVSGRQSRDPEAEISDIRFSNLQQTKGSWYACFVSTSGKRHLSLRTYDKEEASKKESKLFERIHQLLEEQGYFTIRELKDHLEATDAALSPIERKPQVRLGPLKLAYPGQSHTGCQIYVYRGPTDLRVKFAPLHGNDRTTWGTIAFQCPTSSQEKLRKEVRSFIHDRLAQAFEAGYRFRLVALDPGGRVAEGELPEEFQKQVKRLERVSSLEEADLQLTLTPNGTVGFTLRGRERLELDILQGRLDSDFVRNALAADYDNPFDIGISEETVNKLRSRAPNGTEPSWQGRTGARQPRQIGR